MRISLLVLAASASLAACAAKNPPSEAEGAPAPPPPAPVIAPVAARGTETTWSANVEGDKMVIIRPGAPRLEIGVTASTPDGTLAWIGEGNSLVLTKTTCSDNTPGSPYPMTASLTLGGAAMKGCADFSKADKPAEVAARSSPAQP